MFNSSWCVKFNSHWREKLIVTKTINLHFIYLIIIIVIGALGVIKKGSEKFISEIPAGNIDLQEIQKTTLLGTAHVLRKVLSIK